MNTSNEELYDRNASGGLQAAGAARRRVPVMVVTIGVLLIGGLAIGHAADWRSMPWTSVDSMQTLTAPAGRPATFRLPDGSKVTLSPGSTLSYPATLGTSPRRDVVLEGEAYFEVERREDRPFFVRAGALIADIDAKCVVRAYPEDAQARVAVQEGRVEIAGAVISAGQVGRLSVGGEPIIEAADAASWFGWTKGRLAFTGAFGDALPRLSRWYDLELRLADSVLGHAVLVATLPDSAADGVLEVLALALSARVERQGRTVTFYADEAKRETLSPARKTS